MPEIDQPRLIGFFFFFPFSDFPFGIHCASVPPTIPFFPRHSFCGCCGLHAPPETAPANPLTQEWDNRKGIGEGHSSATS